MGTESTTTEARGQVEKAVLDRYAQGAEAVEPQLCCPVEYDDTYLKILPKEIIEKDYGCGDPSRYVREGETVLDLGSGGGKICYILSQKVGPKGKVIGVDFNDKMLTLARKYQAEMAEKIGYANVEFRKGMIQDMALNLDLAEAWLKKHPVRSVEDHLAYQAECERLRREEPLVPDSTVDVVVSNCVLNLVRTEQKKDLFNEINRVLRIGGRAVISDIVCDEDPPAEMIADAELWSGCISGAFREDDFLKRFEEAGFFGIRILVRQEEPWQVVNGIEFRSMTVEAFKFAETPCWERHQAVVYTGPWKTVTDDDGHVYRRGERMAVCDKTFRLLTDPNGPYAGQFHGIEPRIEVPLEKAEPFDCTGRNNTLRQPRETKGLEYNATSTDAGSCCGPDCC